MENLLPNLFKDIFNQLKPEDCTNNLIAYAIDHRLIQLTNIIKNNINKEENNELYNKFLRLTKHTMLLHSELLKIENHFKGNSILIIPFKGTSLSSYLYSNPIIRLSSDIDLLVKAEDFYIAQKLLNDIDFIAKDVIAHNLPRSLIESVGGITFTNEQGLQVDLHCHVSEQRYLGKLKAEDIFNNVILTNQSGGTFNIIEDRLHCLILMLHANKHNWTKAIWLHDIYTLINKKNLCLYELEELAIKYCIKSAFLNYIKLIYEFYPIVNRHAGIEKFKIAGQDFMISILNQSQDKELSVIRRLYNSLKMHVSKTEQLFFLKGLLFSPVPKDLHRSNVTKTSIIIGKFKRFEDKLFVLAVLLTPLIFFLTLINLTKWQILKLIGIPKNISSFRITDSKSVNKKLVKYLVRIVNYTSNRQPYKVTCLVKALTLYQILKLFRQPAIVVIGVEKINHILSAHAWVKVGNIEFFKGINDYKELTDNISNSYDYSQISR
jgi:hypothetical protein